MDWQTILLIVLVVGLLLAGGFIRKLTKEIKDLIDCFHEAIQDGDITKEEWNKILSEGKDVGRVIREIIELIASYRLRR